MFTLGIFTRRIKRITKIIVAGEISKTEVSRLNKTIKEEITAWLNKPIKKKNLAISLLMVSFLR